MPYLHYSSYWGTWSRILTYNGVSIPQGKLGPYIEVNLSPMGGISSGNWEKEVFPIIVRAHGTMADKGDRWASRLPEEVHQKAIEKIGSLRLEALLYWNFLAEIDWEKYRQVCNGGAPLSKILREESFENQYLKKLDLQKG